MSEEDNKSEYSSSESLDEIEDEKIIWCMNIEQKTLSIT